MPPDLAREPVEHTVIANMALQYFTLINPLLYAIDITQRVYLAGAGLGLVLPDLWPLATLATATFSVASWMFRHRPT